MGIAFNKNLVLLEISAATQYELLDKVADNLFKLGYVKDTYKGAVIAREKIFATGLPTMNGGGVAIPHTDIEHVNTAAICFARLAKPVEFVVMGDESSKVKVDLVFMLALKEAHAQIEMLQALMGVIQDEEALDYLKKANVDEICKFVQEKLPDVGA
mgnify:CR=1 FL=1